MTTHLAASGVRYSRRKRTQLIILVHWLLTTWGCLMFGGPYAWANFTTLALGVWAVAQKDSIDAISMFLGGLVVTILLDIIHISIFYPRAGLLDVGRFGAGMAILSLLLKPFSCFMLYNMYLQRGGEAPFRSREYYPGFGSTSQRSAYQTIDSPEAPTDFYAGAENKGHTSQGY
ncbi:type-1 angiotensin II receptor-associated protein isoform X1 [Myotis myotis]|uniref:Angiotensin II receptor associated protein n=2 Tax=Myotis myotis TaxID=51298 RepID=A0A7J7ZSM7_MYOMY|nr:type-1 angiotensin II receptor-associated protein isoform X1 [Myotis myotis]KAF6377099.1 angiotensin II receptor associated protein [Myotis myotis]